MKITRLDLRAYGPFTDAAIEFPSEGPGLQLIQGPNEAGKSSSLRALRYLLFDFPTRVSDGFLHEGKRQRLGATIRGGDGSELVFVRRRGRSKTLRGPDDETILDDAALVRYLGPITLDRFKALFSTDLNELVTGGREIIEGRGDLGAILFGGSGLAQMPQVLRELRAEAEKLYKSQGKIPAINAALAELKKARQEMHEASVSSEKWLRARDDRDDALRLFAVSKAERDRIGTARNGLVRISEALPVLARRAELREALAAIGPAPVLPDNFDERRGVASEALRLAARAVAEGVEAVATIERGLATIEIPEALLAESDAFEGLRERVGDRRKGRESRPGLLRKIEHDEAAVADLWRVIAPGRPISEAGSVRLTKAQKDAINKQIREYGAIETEVASALGSLELHRSAYESAPLGVDLKEARRALEELTATIKRIKASGDLDAARDDALARLRKLSTKAKADLARLPLWSGTLDDLSVAPIPTAETMARFETELARASATIADLEAERKAIAGELATIDRTLAEARRGGDLPAEADLERTRAERDRGWSAVARAWLGGEASADPRGLAVEYERQVAAADLVADRLRREAERVARLAELSARRAGLLARSETIPAAIEDAGRRLARIEAEWADAWRPAAIAPRTPSEMRGWVAKYDALMNQAATIAEASAEVDRAEAKVGAAIESLAAILRVLEEPGPSASGSLAGWIGRAEDVDARGRTGRELDLARAEAKDAEERLGLWREKWSRNVAPLGLPPEATPADAQDAIERVEALVKKAESLKTTVDALAEIDQAAERFACEVDDLAHRVGVASGDRTPEAILDELRRALELGRKAEQERAGMVKALTSRREALAGSRAEVVRQTEALDELRRLAGCESVDDLPAIAEASNRARPLRQELDAAGRRLAELAGGRSVDDLAREAEGVDADALPGRLRDLDAEFAALDAEVEARSREVGRLDAMLGLMDGGPRAADANERARQHLAAIEADVEHYVRFRLAETILKRAIEVYRGRNQGPILGRASSLFASLTAGSFAGIELDDGLDDEDRSDARPVLKGLRLAPVRELVPVEGMSEGTANALFLAVRLATLETHLDPREPLPFIVDDILVQFDDARASAALAALAELGKKTQVLFFTHHDHLIELARAALPPDAWSLHRLPGRA